MPGSCDPGNVSLLRTGRDWLRLAQPWLLAVEWEGPKGFLCKHLLTRSFV